MRESTTRYIFTLGVGYFTACGMGIDRRVSLPKGTAKILHFRKQCKWYSSDLVSIDLGEVAKTEV